MFARFLPWRAFWIWIWLLVACLACLTGRQHRPKAAGMVPYCKSHGSRPTSFSIRGNTKLPSKDSVYTRRPLYRLQNWVEVPLGWIRKLYNGTILLQLLNLVSSCQLTDSLKLIDSLDIWSRHITAGVTESFQLLKYLNLWTKINALHKLRWTTEKC